MAPGTNPAIASVDATTADDIAYQGANGDLWLAGSVGSLDTGHAMAPGTSPAITATGSGYEVAYQCAPPPPPVTVTTATTVTTQSTATATATTTVTQVTPAAPTSTAKRRVRARFEMKLVWNGHSTHVFGIRSVSRLPRGTLITFTCHRDGTRGRRCPRLGKLARKRRTVARELAVVAGRTFAKNNRLIIAVAARRYSTELITVALPGNSRPRISLRWR
jgi:hypothetical protein